MVPDNKLQQLVHRCVQVVEETKNVALNIGWQEGQGCVGGFRKVAV